VEVPVAEPTQPAQRMIVGHFIVSNDVERSRRFYTEVLGGKVIFGPDPTNIALANNYIITDTGGAPTDDTPTVTLETPTDPDRVSSFLNIRVTDIQAAYGEWSARGALRCYIRDPDGYIIEIGQTIDPKGDWWPDGWPPINPERGAASGSARLLPHLQRIRTCPPPSSETHQGSDPRAPWV
jgi:catechol 2,3-dioxygenase-like lactoylglutathione lyase family enzyme